MRAKKDRRNKALSLVRKFSTETCIGNYLALRGKPKSVGTAICDVSHPCYACRAKILMGWWT